MRVNLKTLTTIWTSATLLLWCQLGASKPCNAADVTSAVVTYNPVTLDVPGRNSALSLRVSAPTSGRDLPVILFSHGDKYSKDDYQPLADYWAARGFVVIQPTHLDGEVPVLSNDDRRRATIWRSRIADLVAVIDDLKVIEAAAPALRGRLNTKEIIAVGHSFGGHTVEALAAAKVTDPATGKLVDLSDPRIRAAVFLAAPGDSQSLTPEWAKRAPYLHLDRSAMTLPTLTVVGDADVSTMSTMGWRWRASSFDDAPNGAKCLVVISGGTHFLGGILGVHRTETTDESAERLRAVEEASTAFLNAVVTGKKFDVLATSARLSAHNPAVASATCQ